MRTLLALSLALSAVSPTLASAQDGDSRTTVYEFTDGDLVEGTFERPEGDILWTRTGRAHRTLVVPRPHYVPELMRSVENL